MLTREMVEEIRSLLVAGDCSQRKIAQRLGVSRSMVQAVIRGKYRLFASLKRLPDEEFQPPRGPHRRCPGCGGKVKMPCLRCYLAMQKKSKAQEADSRAAIYARTTFPAGLPPFIIPGSFPR